MREPNVIDAEYQVVEPRYPWRIRFWPSVLFWGATIAMGSAATHNIPTTEVGYVPLYVLGAALISPAARFICSVLSARTDPVDEQAAQILRQRLTRRRA